MFAIWFESDAEACWMTHSERDIHNRGVLTFESRLDAEWFASVFRSQYDGCKYTVKSYVLN